MDKKILSEFLVTQDELNAQFTKSLDALPDCDEHDSLNELNAVHNRLLDEIERLGKYDGPIYIRTMQLITEASVALLTAEQLLVAQICANR